MEHAIVIAWTGYRMAFGNTRPNPGAAVWSYNVTQREISRAIRFAREGAGRTVLVMPVTEDLLARARRIVQPPQNNEE